MRGRQRVVVALALMMLPGCTGWRVIGTSPRALDTMPGHIRVTLATGERVDLKGARLEGDSVIGTVYPDTLTPRLRRAIPVDSVSRIAARGPTATSRTTSFLGGVAVATAVIWLLLFTIAS